ncbi:MAG: PDZ domain-containing protein [Parcubacteria group bacterium]|nr:PDZ domain-containing protein [Parcubacteria group bacterium]
MKNFFSKYQNVALAALLIIGAAFFIGVQVGKTSFSDISKITEISNKETGKPAQVDFSPFWKTWSVLNDKFVETHSTSTASTTSDQKKIWGAISGLADSFDDPYTVFMPPSENELFATEISGNFEGVGMEIGIQDDVLSVVSPLKGTPAYRAGLMPGDKILEINHVSTAKLNTEEAVKLIRGKSGTEVTFTLSRKDRKGTFEISVIRAKIDIPTTDTELLPSGVFVIRLYNFSAVSPNLFRDALRQFIKANTDKMIIDLRGNPGGYLEAAIDMASWFLPSGKTIVIEDFKNKGEQVVHRSKGYDIFTKNLKLVILIDRGSASASEILAGALREQGIATLIGEKSFGKGSVQELVNITPETSLKVTIARWLTPNGKSISNGGLMPDIEVVRSSEDILAGKDPQQDKAVNFLLSK